MPPVRAPVTSVPAAQPPRPTLVSIQCLRGIAALLVVLFHAQGAVAIKLPGRSALNDFYLMRGFGSLGVDVFFVISGFIMVYVSHDRFGRNGAALDFLVRRAIRIVPLYWLMTALMVVLLFFLPRAFDTLRFRVGQAVASFLFLPTTSSAGEMVPVLAVGWTLTYEVIFYILFAALLSTSLRSSIAVTAALFTIAAVAGHLWSPTGPFGATLLSDLFLEFLVGECIALWFLRRGAPGARASRVLLALGVSVFVAHLFFGELRAVPVLAIAVPAGALLLALVSLEQHGLVRFPRWLQNAGDESYSVYLSHMITNGVFFKVCAATHLVRFLPADVLILLAVVNATAWGRLLHRTVERPMTRALTRAWHRCYDSAWDAD